MADLPEEVIQRIVQSTDTSSLGQLGRTSKQLRRVSRDPATIRPVYKRDPKLPYKFLEAAEKGRIEFVRKMEPYMEPAIINPAFLYAVEGGHSDVVQFLLKNSKMDPEVNRLAFVFAVQSPSPRLKHTQIVKMLLDDGRFDPTVMNNASIKKASADGVMRWMANGIAYIKQTTDIVQLFLNDSRVRQTLDPQTLTAIENQNQELLALIQ
jgi:hypothetical protein